MRDLAALFIHLIGTLFPLLGPGGLRSVIAESLLVKHQLLAPAGTEPSAHGPSGRGDFAPQ